MLQKILRNLDSSWSPVSTRKDEFTWGVHSDSLWHIEAVCLYMCSTSLLFVKAVVVHFYLKVLFFVMWKCVDTFWSLCNSQFSTVEFSALFVHDFSCNTELWDHMPLSAGFLSLCLVWDLPINEVTLCGVLLEWNLHTCLDGSLYTGHQFRNFSNKQVVSMSRLSSWKIQKILQK